MEKNNIYSLDDEKIAVMRKQNESVAAFLRESGNSLPLSFSKSTEFLSMQSLVESSKPYQTSGDKRTLFYHFNFDFEKVPFVVSRDKHDGIVILICCEDQNCFISALLGTDKNNNLKLLTTGQLFYSCWPNESLMVFELDVVSRFKGLGVGSLLLKSAENLAVQNDCRNMKLLSKLNASKIRSICQPTTKTGTGIEQLKYPTGKTKQRYSGMFDRNLYFYYSNGFEIDAESSLLKDVYRESLPLIKKKLNHTDLEFGVRGKSYLYRPTDSKFSISNLHLGSHELQDIPIHLSPLEEEKTFVPFKCQASNESLQRLNEFLKGGSAPEKI